MTEPTAKPTAKPAAKPARFRAPQWVGLRFGLYLAAAELLVVILPVMYKLRQSGLLLILATAVLLYGGLFAGSAWLLGRIPALRARPWALLLLLLAGLTAGSAAVGENISACLIFGLPALGMAWAGTTMSGKPSRLRMGLRIVVVVLFGGMFVPLMLPSQRHPGGPAPPPPPADAPNLALIVLDTVRRDHLSTYGYERETSPVLSRLAAGGVRFDDARVNGMWSLPSHATFFTGQHPSVHGAHYEHWALDDDRETLAEVLGAHGYQTVCITGNPLISRSLGTGAGFQVMDESWRAWWVQESLTVFRLLRFAWDRDRDKGGAAGVRFLQRWLEHDRDPQRPLFLFVNVMDPHGPYHDVPQEYQTRFLPDGVTRGQARKVSSAVFFHHVFGGPLRYGDDKIAIARGSFDGATHYGDVILGQLVAALDDAGLRENTLLVVTSDHGELLGEHELWGHVHSLYDELLRVPLVMRYPAQIPPDTVVGIPAEGIDLMPTLLAAAGVPRDDWPATYGRDLAPAWRGEYEALAHTIIAEHFQPSLLPDNAAETMGGDLGELFVRRRALLMDDHKYVLSSSGAEQLFHLPSDPAEQHNLTDGYRQQRAEHRFLLEQWAEAFGASWGEQTQVDQPELDPAAKQRLRELGYLE